MTPLKILNQFFGYDKFRPGQKEIIDAILSDKNVLAVLPTGGGKSICYQIPALLSDSFSVVISPLIALMKDQVDSLNQKQIVSAFINSSLDLQESEKVLRNIDNGEIKLLYVSPEKLENINFSDRIKALKPNFIFVDEAHCISEWGHNFRPSYRKIKDFIEFVGIKSISAFTATATEDVRKDIVLQLGMDQPQVFVKGFERENLSLNVIRIAQKKEKLVEIIKKSELPGIIYTATRRNAEEICEYLRLHGIDSVYYHAGLTSELRRIIQDDFQIGRVKLICATNAFGMGIDKSDIRTLIHYNITPSIENYYQEIGRAGRDDNDSNIFLLYTENDKAIQEFFINNSFPAREQIEIVYNAICDYARIALNNSYDKEIPIDNNISTYLESKNINKRLVESSIKILCHSGYLSTLANIKKHHVQFLMSAEKINSYIKNLSDNEYKDLILVLLREYGGSIFNHKVSININNLVRILNEQYENIIHELTELHNSGIISYDIPSKFPSVKLVGERIKSENILLKLDDTKKLIKHNHDKLNCMIDYVYYEDCKFKYILNYFGQSSADYKCGKCDHCTGNKDKSNNSSTYIEEHIVNTLIDVGTPLKKTTLANILLGKEKHNQFPSISTFGSCIHFTKKQIEESLELLRRNGKLTIDKNEIRLSKSKDILVSNQAVTNKEYENELQIFNLLRQIRKEASAKYNQPAYMICTDEVLRNIARKKPASVSELLEIDGFNQRMFNKVGEEFLSALKECASRTNIQILLNKKNLPENINYILELVQKKYSLSDMESLTKLPEAVISIQIETLLELIPELEIDHFFEKGELVSTYREVDKGFIDIKDLKQKLGNKISYSKLRIALAKKRVN